MTKKNKRPTYSQIKEGAPISAEDKKILEDAKRLIVEGLKNIDEQEKKVNKGYQELYPTLKPYIEKEGLIMPINFNEFFNWYLDQPEVDNWPEPLPMVTRKNILDFCEHLVSQAREYKPKVKTTSQRSPIGQIAIGLLVRYLGKTNIPMPDLEANQLAESISLITGFSKDQIRKFHGGDLENKEANISPSHFNALITELEKLIGILKSEKEHLK